MSQGSNSARRSAASLLINHSLRVCGQMQIWQRQPANNYGGAGTGHVTDSVTVREQAIKVQGSELWGECLGDYLQD